MDQLYCSYLILTISIWIATPPVCLVSETMAARNDVFTLLNQNDPVSSVFFGIIESFIGSFDKIGC